MGEPAVCDDCMLHVPASVSAPQRVPLVLALHGDGGSGEQMQKAWQATSDARGFVLLAPTCPKASGCKSASFWKWYQGPDHDPDWLVGVLDRALATLPVDPARVYATGFSGGSSYLGWFVPMHAERIAAVAYVSGGYPYAPACPRCKVPAAFVIGSADGMWTPFVEPLVKFYEGCGAHELTVRKVPGVGHVGMLGALAKGEAGRVYDWLAPHAAQCLAPAGASDASASPDAASPPVGPLASAAPVTAQPSAPRGCACDATPSPPEPALLLALAWLRFRSRGTWRSRAAAAPSARAARAL